MTIAGTLGQGKLLVLHPAFRGVQAAAPFAFGIQRTIARRLKACGRTTMFALMRTRVETVQFEGEGPAPMEVGDIGLAVADAWPDDAVAHLLVRQFACRWGVVLDMTAENARTKLASRVFEADDQGEARPIAETSFDDENIELPAEVHAIVAEVALRTGVRCLWGCWQDLFDTSDPVAALLALRMTGIASGVEEGVAYHREALLTELRSMLEAAPRSAFVIELVAEVLRGLHKHAASPMHRVGWLRRAQPLAGRPAAWEGLDEELARPVA